MQASLKKCFPKDKVTSSKPVLKICFTLDRVYEKNEVKTKRLMTMIKQVMEKERFRTDRFELVEVWNKKHPMYSKWKNIRSKRIHLTTKHWELSLSKDTDRLSEKQLVTLNNKLEKVSKPYGFVVTSKQLSNKKGTEIICNFSPMLIVAFGYLFPEGTDNKKMVAFKNMLLKTYKFKSGSIKPLYGEYVLHLMKEMPEHEIEPLNKQLSKLGKKEGAQYDGWEAY